MSVCLYQTPDQTKTNRDLEFVSHTPGLSVSFSKNTLIVFKK